MNIKNNMEKISNNANTIFSKYKIKKTTFDLILTFILLAIVILGIVLVINVINNLEHNEEYNFFYGFYVTIVVILFLLGLGVISLIVFLIITIIKHICVINYYKEARFTHKQKINFEFDYKLWQTTSKHSFHSQVLRIKINGEIIERKSRVIYTNHERIGLFKIPVDLQSHTFKREKYIVAFDEMKDEIVVIEI